MLDAIRPLYAYNAWANNRILDTAERMNLQQFIGQNEGARSIREVLVHTASAQWTWLERGQGRSPDAMWNPADFPYVATLRSRWSTVEEETARFIASLAEADLNRDITYVNFRGETWTYPLWKILLHQANHATQHRSEAALLMTERGHSPGDLDLLIYYDTLAAR
jgi:uncharacterized damage-inducible protein DinB